MDATFRTRVGLPLDTVLPAVADLGTYPRWLGIVHGAVPAGDGIWRVEIGARLGPVRRTKRVRMVRAGSEAAGRVRFVRDEDDGRDHPSWVLDAGLVAVGPSTTDLVMHLHYGGAPQLPLLDLVLAQQAGSAGARLEQVLRDAAD